MRLTPELLPFTGSDRRTKTGRPFIRARGLLNALDGRKPEVRSAGDFGWKADIPPAANR